MPSVVIDGLNVDLSELIAAFKQQGGVSREKLREAQKRRSKKYGIAVQEGGALTIPARLARLGAREGDFADPVHFRYPVWLTRSADSITPTQLGQVRNALVRFEQNKGAYDNRSQAVVLDRINQARKKFKIGEFAEKEWTFDIAKLDESPEKQIVYGVALRPNIPDTQGDIISPEQIEFAAHGFLLNSRSGDLNHKERLTKSEFQVVESAIARVDEPPNINRGDWVVAVKLSDRLWKLVKTGEINGFSIKGKGKRILIA